MNSLPYARSFRDLVVYQRTVEVETAVVRFARDLPRDERFALADQMRRSVRSIGAQIAEAWAKRRYAAHFISKLTDADAEQMETQHWLDSAVRGAYLSPDVAKELVGKLEEVGRMLAQMIAKADRFCQDSPSSVREETAAYFTASSDSDQGSPITDYSL